MQEVLTNLKISRMEVKDETDSDVKCYIHRKEIEAVEISGSELMKSAEEILNGFFKKPLVLLAGKQVVEKYI